MNLEITNVNNIYKLKGVLNRRNVHEFQRQFQRVLETLDTIILNIQGLETIDRHGVIALANLHNDSLNKQKRLSIIGCGNSSLFNYFKSQEAA